MKGITMLFLGFVYVFFGIAFGFNGLGINWESEWLWLFVAIDVWYISFALLAIKLWRDGKLELPIGKWGIRR